MSTQAKTILNLLREFRRETFEADVSGSGMPRFYDGYSVPQLMLDTANYLALRHFGRGISVNILPQCA